MTLQCGSDSAGGLTGTWDHNEKATNNYDTKRSR